MGVKIQRVSILGFCVLSLFACANASVNKDPIGGGSGGNSGGGGNIGGGGTINLNLDGSTVKPPSYTGDARPQRCDDKGNCVCMNILSLGKTAGWGANSGSTDNTDAFVTYMNTKSSAKVVLNSNFVSLTPDFLSTYDIIILQSLGDGQKGSGPFWDSKFLESDVKNLETWVRAGGAIISMTGYGGDTAEVNPLNKLLKFAGISYNTDDIFIAGQGDNFDYCRDSSIPYTEWNTANDSNPPLTQALKGVGMFHGRSLNCTGEGCMDIGLWKGMKVAVAKNLDKGHIFAFADEWVTYTSQWGLTDTQWNTSHAECNNHTAKDLYSVPQFWYNIIHWSIPDASCFQMIDVPII